MTGLAICEYGQGDIESPFFAPRGRRGFFQTLIRSITNIKDELQCMVAYFFRTTELIKGFQTLKIIFRRKN